MSAEPARGLEAQIGQWRAFLRRRRELDGPDVEELESHLRDQVEALVESGLDADEAFLVAVKRMGNLDALSREFAREHSERLWKQLVVAPGSDSPDSRGGRREFGVALGLAVAAGAAVKAPALFGQRIDQDAELPLFYVRNASLFVLPLLTAYFVWKRAMAPAAWRWLILPFVAAAVVANAYPFEPDGDTLPLTVLHLPMALWLAVGMAYAGGRWWAGGGRMDFVRFSGELAIYYVLIAIGGGVLMGFTMMMFAAIDRDAGWFVFTWVLPCGVMGAVLVASWLVEAKQSVVENMAPVLTRVFTPLFTAVLLAFLGTMLVTGSPINIGREVLIAFDLLLVLVVGLVLYAVSAHDPDAPPTVFDGLQLLLVLSALVVDVVALAAIASRISQFGLTPNRIAALGENLILLVNLTWSARLYAAFLRGRAPFGALEAWQTAYLPVYAAWAALVVVLFPPLFGFA
ncbi:MAG: permease prefix domain 1-containing protein [Vicinamibacterales bacterium]